VRIVVVSRLNSKLITEGDIMNSSNHIFLNTLKPGDEFSGIYYVQDFSSKIAKNGNPYAVFSIRDKTKVLHSKYWGKISFPDSQFYQISGVCEIYNDTMDVKINTIGPVNAPDCLAVDGNNFLEVIDDFEIEKKKFHRCLKTVQDLCSDNGMSYEHFEIVNKIFNPSFLRSFYVQPADLNTYSSSGGLLLKTIRMFSIVNNLCNIYEITLEDKLALLSVCLLHGIGIVNRIVTPDFIAKSTPEYDLCGYLFYTANMLEQYKSEYESNAHLTTILQGLILSIGKTSFEHKNLNEFVLSTAFLADKKITELKKV